MSASTSTRSAALGVRRTPWCYGIVLVAALALVPCVRAAPAADLFAVAVEIADRSPAERARAARVALQTVVVRITGLASLPASPELQSALATPDKYAIQFGFDERRAATSTRTYLTVRFAEASVRRLIDDAGLPLWSTSRPTVVAWIVVDEPGGRELLGAASEHPFVTALTEQADFRGLPLLLPGMDLDDALAVSPGVVWSGMIDALRQASERYGAEGVIAVRLTADPRGFWQMRAIVDVAGAQDVVEFTTPEPAANARELVNRTADALVARFSAVAGARQELAVRVDGVDDFGRYAGVLAYLGGLEFVDAVRVVAFDRSSLRLAVVTRTSWERLRDRFALDDRLVPEAGVAGDFGEARLRWQDGRAP
jgi:hypothetical protein